MATIGSLMIAIEGRSMKLESELKKARASLAHTQREMQKLRTVTHGIETGVVSGFRNMTNSLATFQGAAALATRAWQGLLAVAGVGALGQAVRQSLALGDSLADVSDQTGVTVQALQKLRFGAVQSGASADLLDRALNILNERLGAAASGSTEAQHKFALLGLNWRELQRAGTEQALLRVADAVQAIQDPTDRAARATELLGERNRAMINFLSQGSAGIQAYGQRLEQLGLVLSTDMATALGDANDALEALGLFLQTIIARAVVQLTPHIQAFAQSVERVAGALFGANTQLMGLSSNEHTAVTVFQAIGGAARDMGSVVRATMADIRGFSELFQALAASWKLFTGQVTPEEFATLKEAARATPPPVHLPPVVIEEKREPPPRRSPPRPLPTLGDLKGGKNAVLEQLERQAAQARGAFSSWEQAIQNIEQEVRQLEVVSPIIQSLVDEAKRAGAGFTSWAAAIANIEQEVRSGAEGLGDWTAAIDRAQTAMRDAVEANRAAAVDLGESLTQQFQTPLERFQQFKEQLEEVAEVMGTRFQPTQERALRSAQVELGRATFAGQGLTIIAQGIGDAFEHSFQGIVQGTLSVSQAFKNMVQSILASIARLLVQKGIEMLLGVVLSGIGGAASGGGAASFGASGSLAMLGRQQGGLVAGRGRGDTVPAMLEPGEFVMSRRAVERLGIGMLARLNRLELPTFQQGGPLGAAPSHHWEPRGLQTMAQGQGQKPQAPQVNITHTAIVVGSEQEAMLKKNELERLDDHIVTVVNRQILGGTGTVINRAIQQTHGAGRR